MGASSDQIDQQIRETRGELDQRLEVLELRAVSGARRYGRVVVGVAVGVLAVGVGVVAYRRYRRKTAVQQLRDMMFESVRDLPTGMASRLKRRLPIKVVVTDRAHEEAKPRMWVGIAGKVAPAVAGSAAGAIMSRLMPGPSKTSAKPSVPPQ